MSRSPQVGIADGNGWRDHLAERADAIKSAGRWRSTRTYDSLGPSGTLDHGPDPVVTFASNDYLGLSSHPAVIEAASAATHRWGTGAGASRLICGTRPVHDELQAELADWKHTEAALVFPTGFAANLGVLTVLGGPGVRIVSDELNHASIIDGARLAGAEVAIYPHLDLAAASALITEWPGRSVLVTDAVFSMDGDAVDMEEAVERCAQLGAALVVDEAHSVWGPNLSGPAGPLDAPPVVRVGTLSKSLGAMGGFVAGPRAVIDLLVNAARPFIFSTGLSPGDAAAALAALHLVRSPEGRALVRRVRAHTDLLTPNHPSPIVPVIIGDEHRAVAASEDLLDLGYWVPAIRPPTVAPGTSRLRITLSAAHDDEHIDGLLAALDRLGLR
ncbi:MAG: 8-amino-7-oxononanoate synthase [Candidatus Microthrix sp.]|nr:8-amino-7-oxononanoate synthase [Candidatus Microthrix sp.]